MENQENIRVLPELTENEKEEVERLSAKVFRPSCSEEYNAICDCLELLGNSKNCYIFANNLIEQMLKIGHNLKNTQKALYYLEQLSIINIQNSGLKYQKIDQLINLTDIGQYICCEKYNISFKTGNIISDYKTINNVAKDEEGNMILDIDIDSYLSCSDYYTRLFNSYKYTNTGFVDKFFNIIKELYETKNYIKLNQLIRLVNEEIIKQRFEELYSSYDIIDDFINIGLLELTYSGLSFTEYEPIIRLSEIGIAFYCTQTGIPWIDKEEKIKILVDKCKNEIILYLLKGNIVSEYDELFGLSSKSRLYKELLKQKYDKQIINKSIKCLLNESIILLEENKQSSIYKTLGLNTSEIKNNEKYSFLLEKTETTATKKRLNRIKEVAKKDGVQIIPESKNNPDKDMKKIENDLLKLLIESETC